MHWTTKAVVVVGAFCFGALIASWFCVSYFERLALDSARAAPVIMPSQEAPEVEMDNLREEIQRNRNNNKKFSSAPRVITAAGEAEMDRLLSGPTKGGVTVISISFDSDGAALATQLETIFKRGGWDVENCRIIPRAIFWGLSASVAPDRSDCYVFDVLWKIFDDLQLEREAYVEPGRTNLTITIGFNDSRSRPRRL